MRRYKSLLNQADLRELRRLADTFHESKKKLRAAREVQDRIQWQKFKADREVYRYELEQRKLAVAMQELIWEKILAPEDYLKE